MWSPIHRGTTCSAPNGNKRGYPWKSRFVSSGSLATWAPGVLEQHNLQRINIRSYYHCPHSATHPWNDDHADTYGRVSSGSSLQDPSQLRHPAQLPPRDNRTSKSKGRAVWAFDAGDEQGSVDLAGAHAASAICATLRSESFHTHKAGPSTLTANDGDESQGKARRERTSKPPSDPKYNSEGARSRGTLTRASTVLDGRGNDASSPEQHRPDVCLALAMSAGRCQLIGQERSSPCGITEGH
jgi:hypothetical protein